MSTCKSTWSSSHRKRLRGLLEGGANGAELDVGVDDGGVGGVGLDVLGLARVGGASTTANTGGGRVLVGGVGGVEPQHGDRMVIPKGHDKDVSVCKGLSHAGETTTVLEASLVAEDGLLSLAEIVGDGVTGDALVGGVGVLVHLAVLNVESLDLAEGGARADELGDDSHLLGRVEGLAGAVEVSNTHAIALLIC